MILNPNSNSMTELQFEALNASQVPILNHFLKQYGEQTAGRGDWNFWLKKQGKIIAAARLIPLEGDSKKGLWLRGVFVVEEHRHQGVGQLLMRFIHQYVQNQAQKFKNQTEQACSLHIYAFPHGHLTAFYAPLGYQSCLPEALPVSLQKRFLQAKNSSKDWLSMHYEVKC